MEMSHWQEWRADLSNYEKVYANAEWLSGLEVLTGTSYQDSKWAFMEH